jgi:hypothetical protein
MAKAWEMDWEKDILVNRLGNWLERRKWFLEQDFCGQSQGHGREAGWKFPRNNSVEILKIRVLSQMWVRLVRSPAV